MRRRRCTSTGCEVNRRGLLAGILAAGFAPAAIGSGILMPVRRIACATRGISGLSLLTAAQDRADLLNQSTALCFFDYVAISSEMLNRALNRELRACVERAICAPQRVRA